MDKLSSQRFNYYYDEYYWLIIIGGISIDTIRSMAQADANDYICSVKELLKPSCINNWHTFYSTFDKANIMDWSNNKIGRDYGVSNPSYSTTTMFNVANTNGELILDDDDVTAEFMYSFWGTNIWK
jgi:hypothetical protein